MKLISNDVRSKLDKITNTIYYGIEIICKLLFIVMVFSISYAVFGRFVLKSAPRWCEELGILCMVWICFLSSTLAIKDGTHIRMTLLEVFLPKSICHKLHLFSYIGILAISIIWMIYGYQVVLLSLVPRMPSTQLSMAWLYSTVMVTGFCGIIMSISKLLESTNNDR